MSDAMSFAELAEQYVELLPARTVLSLWHVSTGRNTNSSGGTGGCTTGNPLLAGLCNTTYTYNSDPNGAYVTVTNAGGNSSGPSGE